MIKSVSQTMGCVKVRSCPNILGEVIFVLDDRAPGRWVIVV